VAMVEISLFCNLEILYHGNIHVEACLSWVLMVIFFSYSEFKLDHKQ